MVGRSDSSFRRRLRWAYCSGLGPRFPVIILLVPLQGWDGADFNLPHSITASWERTSITFESTVGAWDATVDDVAAYFSITATLARLCGTLNHDSPARGSRSGGIVCFGRRWGRHELHQGHTGGDYEQTAGSVVMNEDMTQLKRMQKRSVWSAMMESLFPPLAPNLVKRLPPRGLVVCLSVSLPGSGPQVNPRGEELRSAVVDGGERDLFRSRHVPKLEFALSCHCD